MPSASTARGRRAIEGNGMFLPQQLSSVLMDTCLQVEAELCTHTTTALMVPNQQKAAGLVNQFYFLREVFVEPCCLLSTGAGLIISLLWAE